jgi:hypothetical protein
MLKWLVCRFANSPGMPSIRHGRWAFSPRAQSGPRVAIRPSTGRRHRSCRFSWMPGTSPGMTTKCAGRLRTLDAYARNFGSAALSLGLLLLAATLGNVAWAQGSTAFDGQYVGQLTLTKVISGDCTPPPPGSLFPLTISEGQVEFKYVPRFDTILRGRVAENGTFTASRLLRNGRVGMTGRVRDNNVTARITSPSCKYTFRTAN